MTDKQNYFTYTDNTSDDNDKTMENLHKQIIIDGVDVSGCSYYADSKCTNSHMLQSNCKNVAVCYYKEYRRKEQECEELKKELQKNFEEKDTLHLIIDRLLEASGYDTNTASAEDFEDVYEHMRYEQQQLDQLKAENEHLSEKEKEARHYLEEAQKYKQTLAEIKEIAKPFCDECKEFGGGLHQDRDCMYCNYGKILQKIECEGTND